MGLQIGDYVETSYLGHRQPWMEHAIKRFKKPWKVTALRTNSVNFVDGSGAYHTWLVSELQRVCLEND